jgi:general L-amino acid transport system permease protein
MSSVLDNVSSNPLASIWFDERYRSVIMQILVLAALFAFLAFIISNAISNLAALGQDFSFKFLFSPAKYDINQSLIDYSSTDTHLRAMVVGILNTALVAVCGIFLATILGFLLGILRLSSNWLVSRLVYCWIEFTRNVPVLIQILLWHGIIVHSLPRPKNALEFGEGWFLSNRGFFIPKPILESGFVYVLIGLLLGIIFAIWYSKRCKRLQAETGKIYPTFTLGLLAVIGTPTILYFLAGSPVSLELPVLQRFNFSGGMVLRPEFTALCIALSVYTASFIAENVRSGIQSVNRGQTEAAYALGMRPNRTMRQVIIPQALRVIIPPLSSQYLNLTKNSSLAIAIGYMDIVATIGGITLNQEGRAIECMIITLALYLCFSLLISTFMNWYNDRIALIER